VLDSEDSYTGNAGLALLARKIGRLPEATADAFSSVEAVVLPGVSVRELKNAPEGVLAHFTQGVQGARFKMQRKVEELRKLPETARGGREATQSSSISDLKKSFEEKSRKNRAFCERMKGGIR
jgi:hypothetical protein